MIEKEIKFCKMDIMANGEIGVQNELIITENGQEISKTYNRCVYAPGDNIDNEDQRVQDIAAVIWTDDVTQNYKRQITIQ